MSIRQILRSDPNILVNQVMRNPKFRDWMAQNHGKTPKQVCEENGINFDDIKSLM